MLAGGFNTANEFREILRNGVADPFERLKKVGLELRQSLEAAEAAHAAETKTLHALREAVRAVEEALLPLDGLKSGSAWPAGRRQVLFYWAVFLAGGDPQGDFVSEEEVNRELENLSIKARKFSVAQLRENASKRINQHFELVDDSYRLLPAAVPSMTKLRSEITGIPADISPQISEK